MEHIELTLGQLQIAELLAYCPMLTHTSSESEVLHHLKGITITLTYSLHEYIIHGSINSTGASLVRDSPCTDQ